MAMPKPEPFAMTLEEAMRTQRAIRRLKPDPVDDALVLKCIELALEGADGSNAQNWEFVVVKDREVKAKLARLNRTAWAAYGGSAALDGAAAGRRKMLRIIDAVQWQADHFEEIPVLVVACLNAGSRPGRRSRRRAATARSIRPCRTCCWRRAPRGSAPRSSRCRSGATLARRALGLPWNVTPSRSCRWGGRRDATGRRRGSRSKRWCRSIATAIAPSYGPDGRPAQDAGDARRVRTFTSSPWYATA